LEHKPSRYSEVKQQKDNRNNKIIINKLHSNIINKKWIAKNNHKQFASTCISECRCKQNPQLHTLNKKLELHRPAPARALELTCAAVELAYDACIHTYLYCDSVIFLCNVIFVFCFCKPPSSLARIYVYKPIIKSPKAQDPERRDLIAQD